MSETTAVDFQKSINERLNAKLKDALIDLIPPEVLQEKADQAATYFLNSRTQFDYPHERERYRIQDDPNTLIGMIYAEMRVRAAKSIKEAFDNDEALKTTFADNGKRLASEAIRTLVIENAGEALFSLMGGMMAMQLQMFSNNLTENMRRQGINI